MPATVQLSEWNTILGTRLLGEDIRATIAAHLQEADRVIVDFVGVEMMSHSFADECFGKLILEIGPHVYQDQIRFVNIPNVLKPILRYAISERLNRYETTVPPCAFIEREERSMNLEGLNAVLTKEEVVATQAAEALLQRPREVDDAYKAHVRTYIPLHAGRGESRISVEEFASRLIMQVKDNQAPRGYLTADFGYGKTSTALYLWAKARDSNLLAVPPFQMTRLPSLIVATYGWVDYCNWPQKLDHVLRWEN